MKFSRPGRSACLVLDTAELGEAASTASAVVVNTDSRHFKPEAAYEAVKDTVLKLIEIGAKKIFKKIDSTMRGNIAEEIAAILDTSRYKIAVVCPAAPKNGRTVVDGKCFVDGKALTSPSLARDIFAPVADDEVSAGFDSRFPGSTAQLSLSDVRGGKAEIAGKILSGAKKGVKVFFADAETASDLSAIAELHGEGEVLLAGSSGLAEALAELSKGALISEKAQGPALAVAEPKTPELGRFSPGRVCFVVGSLTPTSREQCSRLAALGTVSRIKASSEAAVRGPGQEIQRILDLSHSISDDTALLVQVDNYIPAEIPEKTVKRGIKVSRFLGGVALAVGREKQIQFFFVSGGDTAASVVSAFKADKIFFTEELLPGVPFGYFHSKTLDKKIFFASKSGGFGSKDSMARILEKVAGVAEPFHGPKLGPAPTVDKEFAK